MPNKKIILIAAILFFGIFGVIKNSEAKNLYVSTAGNDATSYTDNNVDHPWASIGRAAWGSINRDTPNGSQAAQAGDTVLVQPGIYDAPGSGGARYYPYYNPANSGTSGNFITFKADGEVELRSSSSSARALIGSYQRDYIVWDGFTLNENYITVAPDTGPVVFWDCSYSQAKNLHITGINRAWGDNHNAVRINTADHITVENCYMTGYIEDHGAGVMTYDSSYVTLQNNEVTNSQHGLFVKGYNPGPFTLRYNYIHDCDLGIRFGGLWAAGAEAYQNLIVDCRQGFKLNSFGTDGPKNVRIFNNTIFRSTEANIYMEDYYNGLDNVLVQNNILANGIIYGMNFYSSSIVTSNLTSNYNDFYNNTAQFSVAGSNHNLATWQSTYSQDANSLTNNPLFTNPSGTFSQIKDFALASGSPCKSAGINQEDMGADVSLVGIQSTETPDCTAGQTQSCSTGLQGICATGTQTCNSGSWGSCVQNQRSTTEICGNGIDEDCNGSDLTCTDTEAPENPTGLSVN